MRGWARGLAERHRRSALALIFVVLVAVLVLDASRVQKLRNRLGAAGFDSALFIGLAVGMVLAAVCCLMLLRPPRARPARIVGYAVSAVAMAAVAWAHPRYADHGLRSRLDLGAAVAGDVAFLAAVVAATFRAVAGRRRPDRRRPRRPADTHSAEVWHVQDNQKPPTFEPYFVAHCSCDWVGPTRTGEAAESEAYGDARSHAPQVAPAVLRPLG